MSDQSTPSQDSLDQAIDGIAAAQARIDAIYAIEDSLRTERLSLLDTVSTLRQQVQNTVEARIANAVVAASTPAA